MSDNVRLVDFGYPHTKATGRAALAAELRKMADEIEANEDSKVRTLIVLGLDEHSTVPALLRRTFTDQQFTRAEYVFVLAGEMHHAYAADAE